MSRTSSLSIFTLIVLILFVALFVFFVYAFLHESGHALLGILLGQSLTEFDVSFWKFSAHVGMVGGELSRSQLAVRAVAGASLPFLVWTIFISLLPHKASFTLETLKLISSMAVINTLLPWIVLPILFLFGKAPADDVTNFLQYSQIPPLMLTCIALILYGVGWILFLSKINGLRNEFLLFRFVGDEQIRRGAQITVPILASIMLFCVALTFTVNSIAGGSAVNKFSPPSDYSSVAVVDLSSRPYSAETLASFSVDQPALAGVFIVVHDINTTYFDLSVTGPNGFNSVVLHGEGYRAAIDGGLWQQNLMPGTYKLMLTSQPSSGSASIYLPKQK
jgi:hypothetical protein